jgi:hypothetical protein
MGKKKVRSVGVMHDLVTVKFVPIATRSSLRAVKFCDVESLFCSMR